MKQVPELLRHWSLDEVAECLDGLTSESYADLWQTLSEAEQAGKAKPPGGDGSDGTFEEPVITSGEYGSDLVAGWPLLKESTRINIIEAEKARRTKFDE